MLSIQETVQKDQVKQQMKQIAEVMDSYGFYHPSLKSKDHKPIGLLTIDDEALRWQLQEMFSKIPLREFLAKSGTTGIAGAIYLVPDALHNHLIGASYASDKVPLFSAEVVNGWEGGDLKVDIARRQKPAGVNDAKWTMKPAQFSGGGQLPTQTVEAIQATIAPKSFGVSPRITNDLVEDTQAFGLVEWHLTQAAQQIGQYATDLAIADLKAASDGDGAQAAVTAGSGTTGAIHIVEAIREIGAEFWNPDTLIITYEAWGDEVGHMTGKKTSGGAAGDYYDFELTQGLQFSPIPAGYDAKFQMLNTIFNNSANIFTTVTTGKMTACISLVLDKSAALLCGRKRWMQINKYSEPVRDISAATITCRQDCVTLYKDASCEITET